MGKTSRSLLRDGRPICSVEAAVSLFDGRWKCLILWQLLQDDTLRFGELRRRIPGATARMLTNQLRELEEDGLLHREVYPQVPPKVEYSLTMMGKDLSPIFTALREWGDAHLRTSEPEEDVAATSAPDEAEVVFSPSH
jgi:DNA-binding HxlR family transcriptional regulator